MTTAASALYFGQVVHQRVRPRRHRLSYRVFSMLIDLDELETLPLRLRLFSHNRFNLFSFFDRDHGPGDGSRLRRWVEEQLARGGVALDDGAVRLLCYPRILGYVFNPLSVYFCYGRSGEPVAILYEVSNTFGQRHTYLVPVGGDPRGPVRQECAKAFYVSPFNKVEGCYRFRIDPPADKVSVVINHGDEAGLILHASFTGRHESLTDGVLLRAFLRYPLMTLKVIAGIHWEALRLWRKGLRIIPRAAPPSEPVTIVGAPGSTRDPRS